MAGENNISSDAWYAFDGEENDVVLSTRVRLARNLANFPFPSKFKEDDAFRVRTLVFDAFSHCAEPDRFQGVVAGELDELGSLILEERGVLDSSAAKENGSGIIVRTDGKVSCEVNTSDHVRLSAFVPGLDGNAAFNLVAKLDDEKKQNRIYDLINDKLKYDNDLKIGIEYSIKSIEDEAVKNKLLKEIALIKTSDKNNDKENLEQKLDLVS